MKLAGKLVTTGLAIGGVLGTLSVVNRMTETMAGEIDTVLTGEALSMEVWGYVL